MASWTAVEETDTKGVYYALTDPETSGAAVFAVAMKVFDAQWLVSQDTDQVDLFEAFREAWEVEIHSDLLHKLDVMRFSLTDGLFYSDPDAFSLSCITLATGAPALSAVDDLTVGEMLAGIAEVNLIQESYPPFSPAVKNFQNRMLEREAADADEFDTPMDVWEHYYAYVPMRLRKIREDMLAMGLTAAADAPELPAELPRP